MQRAIVYRLAILSSLLGFALSGHGQISSGLGRFEVDVSRGCAPLTVTVNNTSGEINDQYFFDADTCNTASAKYDAAACSAMAPVSSTSYTYTQPGTYTIVQVLTNLVPRTDSLVIEVFDTQVPQFSILRCNNFRVQVVISDTYYDQFQVDYGDGSPPTSSLTHNYPPGAASYPVTVSGFFNNGPVNCGDSTVTVTPVNNLPNAVLGQVSVDVASVSSGQITLDYTLSPQVDYRLEMSINGTSSFTEVGPLSGSTHTLTALNTSDDFYCFRIATVDACTNNRNYSYTVCSNALAVTAQNRQNQLDWQTEPVDFNRFEIIKNSQVFGPPIVNSSTNSLTDTLVACNIQYCYQVITYENNGARSLSDTICVTGINNSQPPTVQSLTASVQGNQIVLDWQVPDTVNFPMVGYTVNRSVNGGAFRVRGTGTTAPFVDTGLRTEANTYCYYLTYQDGCGNVSEPSVTACAVLLRGESNGSKEFLLDWTAYTGWSSGLLEYRLEILDENGLPVGPSINLGLTTSYMDPISTTRQITKYRVVAVSNDSNPLISYSNIVVLDIPLQVHVPNSFTPNNDGLNDTFMAKGLFIDVFSMEIYSRWGELLYHTTDPEQGWNGSYQGVPVPDGTYVYQITAYDARGRSIQKKGTVHVLKKMN